MTPSSLPLLRGLAELHRLRAQREWATARERHDGLQADCERQARARAQLADERDTCLAAALQVGGQGLSAAAAQAQLAHADGLAEALARADQALHEARQQLQQAAQALQQAHAALARQQTKRDALDDHLHQHQRALAARRERRAEARALDDLRGVVP